MSFELTIASVSLDEFVMSKLEIFFALHLERNEALLATAYRHVAP